MDFSTRLSSRFLGFLFPIILIMVFGLLLITSAGSAVSEKLNLSSYFFLKRQILFLLIGLFLIFLIRSFDIVLLKRFILTGFLLTIAFLILVLFLGNEAKGAKRWINIMSFSLQPSEFLKPFYTCFIAIVIAGNLNKKTILNIIITNSLVVTLLVLEPDFGMSITNTLVAFFILFIAGLKLRWVLLIFLVSLCALSLGYFFVPHVANRINKFINPLDNSNYQVNKSILSYLDGGFFGKGPGEGTVKYVLPDAHTDFIFAVAAEEYGAFFCLIIIATFTYFIIVGFLNIMKLNNLFAIYSCFGILMHIAVQFLFNIGVTLNIFPTKGMTLPFVSYGGSSVIAFSIAVGIYLNIISNQKFYNRSIKSKFFYIKN